MQLYDDEFNSVLVAFRTPAKKNMHTRGQQLQFTKRAGTGDMHPWASKAERQVTRPPGADPGGPTGPCLSPKTIKLLCDTASGLVGLVSSNRLPPPPDGRLDPPLRPPPGIKISRDVHPEIWMFLFPRHVLNFYI